VEDLSYLPLLAVLPFIAVGGLLGAAWTRADRSRWSAEMKAFLGLLVVSVAVIVVAVLTAPPPRPG
jgi:peptidoglycan/LPS O-acetylase OafA/YrhL